MTGCATVQYCPFSDVLYTEVNCLKQTISGVGVSTALSTFSLLDARDDSWGGGRIASVIVNEEIIIYTTRSIRP